MAKELPKTPKSLSKPKKVPIVQGRQVPPPPPPKKNTGKK